MMTPREALAIMNHPEDLKRFEEAVDRALDEASNQSRWPCAIAVTSEFAPHAETLVRNYRGIGWRVQIFDGQHPGDNPFLQFQRPTP